MNKPPAFQLYAADFDMDTNTWTNEEVGIYLRLLLSEWVNGALPNDPVKLAKIVRISPKKFTNLFQNISHKFISDGNGNLKNNRLEREREKQLLWREKSRLGGISSGKTRRRVVQPPLQPPHEPKGNTSSSSSRISTILADSTCPQKEIVDTYHRILPELQKVIVWNESRQKTLRARWRESEKRQSLEWWEGFFNHVRESDFLMGKKTDFQADLEWLIRPKNFPKVLEGRYHR